MPGIVDTILQHALGLPELITPFADRKKVSEEQVKEALLALPLKFPKLSASPTQNRVELKYGSRRARVSREDYYGGQLKIVCAVKPNADALFRVLVETYGRLRVGSYADDQFAATFGGVTGGQLIGLWTNDLLDRERAIGITVFFSKTATIQLGKTSRWIKIEGVSDSLVSELNHREEPVAPGNSVLRKPLKKRESLLRDDDGVPVAIKRAKTKPSRKKA